MIKLVHYYISVLDLKGTTSNDTFGRNSYIHFGLLCILEHRSSDYPGHNMDQKSKEREEQIIRSSWYHIHYRYCFRYREPAMGVHHDRRIFWLGMKKDYTINF